jgi:hypothetical protein
MGAATILFPVLLLAMGDPPTTLAVFLFSVYSSFVIACSSRWFLSVRRKHFPPADDHADQEKREILRLG